MRKKRKETRSRVRVDEVRLQNTPATTALVSRSPLGQLELDAPGDPLRNYVELTWDDRPPRGEDTGWLFPMPGEGRPRGTSSPAPPSCPGSCPPAPVPELSPYTGAVGRQPTEDPAESWQRRPHPSISLPPSSLPTFQQSCLHFPTRRDTGKAGGKVPTLPAWLF